MKLSLVVLLAVAVAAAAQEDFLLPAPPAETPAGNPAPPAPVSQVLSGQDESEAEILSSDFVRDEAGGYRSKIVTSNQIQQSVTGKSDPGPEPETGSYRMEGEYSYTAPNGELIKVTWYADETGYHAESDSIPVAPEAVF